MLNGQKVNKIIENNAHSTDILIKHYCTTILYMQLRNGVVSKLKNVFYKLYYLNNDNFCIVCC
jgi:hypothetical protein